ncbi:MAG: DUF5069 domain-containing protein [Opitutus sp.]|nr:DUF5069 domain-containing protein [Opitutus sp.]
MRHYDFPHRFSALYARAVAAYAQGARTAAALLPADDQTWLAANGISTQHLFDYAEDHHGYAGEPGVAHALAIELVRRDYFLNVQGGRPPTIVLDAAKLPEKAEAVRGIAWLPRLLPKARAKLAGELPPSLMYLCGGDRKFFREHGILPAEFLTLVWRLGQDDQSIADWVVRRSGAK